MCLPSPFQEKYGIVECPSVGDRKRNNIAVRFGSIFDLEIAPLSSCI